SPIGRGLWGRVLREVRKRDRHVVVASRAPEACRVGTGSAGRARSPWEFLLGARAGGRRPAAPKGDARVRRAPGVGGAAHAGVRPFSADVSQVNGSETTTSAFTPQARRAGRHRRVHRKGGGHRGAE